MDYKEDEVTTIWRGAAQISRLLVERIERLDKGESITITEILRVFQQVGGLDSLPRKRLAKFLLGLWSRNKPGAHTGDIRADVITDLKNAEAHFTSEAEKRADVLAAVWLRRN